MLQKANKAGYFFLDMTDQGRAVRVEAEDVGVDGRDRSWNLFARQFIEANAPNLSAIEIAPVLHAERDRIDLRLKPGGRIGAVPLRSPITNRIIGGVVVRPRFGWYGIGPLMHAMGWSMLPTFHSFPLVPGASSEVPPWVLAGPMLERLQALVKHRARGFLWQSEVRSTPRGTIDWQAYSTRQMATGTMHLLPCRFPELDADPILNGMIRWAAEVLSTSLAPWCSSDLFARSTWQRAVELLHGLDGFKPVIPTHQQLHQMMSRSRWASSTLTDGLQALEWLVDKRGMGGCFATDGLPWSMSMHELFERWVEHSVRLWAQQVGARIRVGGKLETSVPLHWERAGASGLTCLVPDIVVESQQKVWFVDAKYKGHFEEMDETRWRDVAEDLRSEHRHDVHQVLAYASTSDSRGVSAVLVYPVQLAAWQSLFQSRRHFAKATIDAGQRQLELCLLALPIGMTVNANISNFIAAWNDVLSGGEDE